MWPSHQSAEQVITRVVDVSTTIGILLIVAKGGGILLRRHQRLRVQRGTKAIAKYLDDVRPLGWFGRLTKKKAKILLALSSVLLYVAYTLRHGATYQGPDRFLPKFVLGLTLCFVIGFFVYFFYSYVTYPMVKWLLGNDKVSVFLLKFGLVSVGYLIFTYATRGFVDTGFWKTFLYGMLFLSLVLTWYLGAIILCILILILLAQVLLLMLRAVVWRIVDYNHGAWAGIVLIITIILGIVDLMIRVK